mgnify:CR=1 FL=1
MHCSKRWWLTKRVIAKWLTTSWTHFYNLIHGVSTITVRESINISLITPLTILRYWSKSVLKSRKNKMCWFKLTPLLRSLAIFMASIQTWWDSFGTGECLMTRGKRPISTSTTTCSLVITLIEDAIHLRPSASWWPLKLNSQPESPCCVVITKTRVSECNTVSLLNADRDLNLNMRPSSAIFVKCLSGCH